MKYIISILTICLLCSCSAVKPYERQYINDPEMQTASHTGSAFKNYVFSIREGAMPVTNQKSSGGCGCN